MRDICAEWGFTVGGNKQALFDRVKGDLKPQSFLPKLDSHRMEQLKWICRIHKITKFTGKNRAELIEFIRSLAWVSLSSSRHTAMSHCPNTGRKLTAQQSGHLEELLRLIRDALPVILYRIEQAAAVLSQTAWGETDPPIDADVAFLTQISDDLECSVSFVEDGIWKQVSGVGVWDAAARSLGTRSADLRYDCETARQGRDPRRSIEDVLNWVKDGEYGWAHEKMAAEPPLRLQLGCAPQVQENLGSTRRVRRRTDAGMSGGSNAGIGHPFEDMSAYKSAALPRARPAVDSLISVELEEPTGHWETFQVTVHDKSDNSQFSAVCLRDPSFLVTMSVDDSDWQNVDQPADGPPRVALFARYAYSLLNEADGQLLVELDNPNLSDLTVMLFKSEQTQKVRDTCVCV